MTESEYLVLVEILTEYFKILINGVIFGFLFSVTEFFYEPIWKLTILN